MNAIICNKITACVTNKILKAYFAEVKKYNFASTTSGYSEKFRKNIDLVL